MESRGPRQAGGRLLPLVAAAALVPLGGLLGGAPALGMTIHLARALARQDARPLLRLVALPLDEVLAGVLGLALVAATLLWALALLLAIVEVTAGVRLAALARRVPCPPLARGLALAVLGTALVSAPASAEQRGHGAAAAADPLAGLPLPDRAATAPPVAAPTRLVARPPLATFTVRPGDTLWAIAARHLPDGTTDAEIDAAWRRIAAVNHRVVPDPHLIFPGTELSLPLPHRKDHP